MGTHDHNSKSDIWMAIEVTNYCVPTICVILAVYYNIKLYNHKNETFVSKRSLSVLFGLNIFLIFTIIAIAIANYAFLHSNEIWQLISFNICLTSFWLILYFLLVKNWMIYYKYYWTYYTLETEWRQLINNNVSHITANTNWFILNNYKYGNLMYIYKLFAIICFIGLFINISAQLFTFFFAHYHPLSITMICLSVSTFPVIIFYIFIIYKIPSLQDPFYIHWESKMHAKLLLIFVIMSLIVQICIVGIHYHNIVLFTDPIISIILFSINYVSSAMLLIKNKDNINNNGNNDETSSTKQETDLEASNVGNISQETDLKSVFSNKSSLHMFMIHLSKEYSMECGLSLIEINQFQQYIKEHSTDNEVLSSEINPIVLASSIPISSIIEYKEGGDTFMYNAKMKVYKIYNKYIKVGSQFEINISGSERNKMRNLLDNLDGLLLNNDIKLNDLYILFEDTKVELLKLLFLSLNRLKQEPEYVQIRLRADSSISSSSPSNTNNIIMQL